MTPNERLYCCVSAECVKKATEKADEMSTLCAIQRSGCCDEDFSPFLETLPLQHTGGLMCG